MQKYGPSEIERFLRSIDKHLKRSVEVVLIGGAAAAVSFGSEGFTMDIDALSRIDSIQGAIQHARQETNLEIPVARVTVSEVPYDYESRLVAAPIRGLKKLRILTPERYDWALMKIARLIQKDIEGIREVHNSKPYETEKFLKRFLEEMNHIMPQRKLVENFLAMMEELYGEGEADEMEEELRKNPRWEYPA